MNENIDLTKILKDCPEGTKLYSTIFGDVEFCYIDKSSEYPIKLTAEGDLNGSVSANGKHYVGFDGECTLFPSKEQRDWSKFTAPWYKKEKFDPKTLKPFDKILVRRVATWFAAQFSHIAYDLSEYDLDNCEEKLDFIICTTGSADFSYCIPYNADTKHLVGTTEEAPDFYKYWED